MTPTMSSTTSEDRTSSFITIHCPQSLPSIVAEHLLQWQTLADPDPADPDPAGADPAGADPADDYECWEPQELVFAALEPAATSPFMDF